ncbi:hypothetical protein PR001_g5564 [Phytophthora rubi]|uniref:non-specific serine/threonine protein kinase n=1 Tax=Phytophthora rubi TaxID=129364 RepID=A0A6A3NNG6_9STRA|nr:hypothetical protein PR001_g5564 [Phytophthora rubi]
MDKYVKVRKIGQGSFGCAYLATRKAANGTESSEQLSKHQFVIKEVVLDPRDQASAQREARLLAALDHPNIIACKESFLLKTPTPNAAFLGRHQRRPTVLCIVTEFADGGDLSHELARRTSRHEYFEPDDLLGLFVQVCLALKHLHDRKILHRDVKPANIFLTKSGVVKLGDLGVATVLSHTLACAQTSIGTPYYTAPEICLGKRYNAKADVWSLGCVLFEMASFSHAFEGRSQRQLFDNIVRGVTPRLPSCGILNRIQRELQALVDDMLRKEPRARPSVNQLIRRPLVLARIQSFLSARALASELNHTVLHGENVFRKKMSAEDKVVPIAPLAQHKNAELVHDSTRNETEEDDLELTSLPSMANLEFERMVLQLKSAVESDMNSSEDEIDDEDEQSGGPPPPYSPSLSLEALNIAVLEDPAFRLALQKRLQLQSNATEQIQVNSADQLDVDSDQHAALDWMYTYIASLL